MASIILTDKKEAIINGVNTYLSDIDAHMNIYQICRGKNRVVQFGVNWAACGTVLPEEAKRFSDILSHAAHICEVLNAYQWTEKFGSDYESEEDYAEDVASVIAGLNGGLNFKELIDTII